MKISVSEINECVQLGLGWLTSMTRQIGKDKYAIYERFMINLLQIKKLFRPDCCAEFGLLLSEINEDSQDLATIREGIKRWLLESIHNNRYFFGFDEEKKVWVNQSWINDNSKVLIYFINEEEYAVAEKIARFLLDAQDVSGGFKACLVEDREWFPVFVTTTNWATYSLLRLYSATKNNVYLEAALKGLDWLINKQKQNGRITTTYELYRGEPMRENWRPPSSETAEVILPLVEASRLGFNEYRKNLEAALSWLMTLQHESGGIMNCDDESINASEECNKYLADLVYTNSYALLSAIEALKVTMRKDLETFVEKLATFLMKIQVREDVFWKGGWRGSYDLMEKKWAGRSLLGGNFEEEGGMYSVYTGWSAAVILLGLTKLAKIIQKNI
ncbi:MAG: prenyltransferase/squalene oxidase repeat-containing protein [Nitrososphaerota archaeon]